MSESIPPKRKWLYIVAPFCLLLLCLGGINGVVWLRSRPLAPLLVTVTAVPAATPLSTRMAFPELSPVPPQSTLIPTPLPTPSPTYAPPSYSKESIIRLLGPPPDTVFAASDSISFYWQWPLPLTPDQQFHIYLFDDGQTILLGTIAEPNIGDSYHLSVNLADINVRAGSVQWIVQLETSYQIQPLRSSESRFLTFLASSSSN